MSPPRGPEGPAGAGTIPSAFVSVNPAYALTPAWADIPGATVTVTLGTNGYVVATAANTWTGNNGAADFRIVIDGVAGDATHSDVGNNSETLAVLLRSGPLLAGPHVVKVQVMRTAGNDGSVEHVDLSAFGTVSE